MFSLNVSTVSCRFVAGWRLFYRLHLPWLYSSPPTVGMSGLTTLSLSTLLVASLFARHSPHVVFRSRSQSPPSKQYGTTFGCVLVQTALWSYSLGRLRWSGSGLLGIIYVVSCSSFKLASLLTTSDLLWT